MQSGDVIDLDITGVAHGGVFVGRHEGRVVFVPDTIPGERVRVRLSDVGKAAFWRGETIEVLDASPHRRPHVWPQADVEVAPERRPGGADFGHIDLGHQRELKRQVAREALERVGGIALPVTMAPAAPPRDGSAAPETPDGTGWRTRVSLHVDADGRIGPFAARSHRVIAVTGHPLATPAVEAAALRLSTPAPGRVDLVQPADGVVRVIPRPQHERRRPRDRRRPGDRRRARSASSAGAGPAPGHEVVTERAGGREFRVDAGGFWQVHRLAASSLAQLVSLRLGGLVDPDAHHLDLYGGVGLFAAALADAGGTRVTTVESDARATAHAVANLAEWPDARAETGRVDRWLEALAAQASDSERGELARGVVVLDPPRAGAGREVVTAVAALAPSAVAYVACDPVALARDLATFRAAGYDTGVIDALDLFPNSHHVEALAVLRPRASLNP